MSLQDNAKKSPEVVKMRPRLSQELPKAVQEAPEKPQEVARRLPDALRRALEAPSTSKMTPATLQQTSCRPLRPLQQASERGRRQMGVSPLNPATELLRGCCRVVSVANGSAGRALAYHFSSIASAKPVASQPASTAGRRAYLTGGMRPRNRPPRRQHA